MQKLQQQEQRHLFLQQVFQQVKLEEQEAQLLRQLQMSEVLLLVFLSIYPALQVQYLVMTSGFSEWASSLCHSSVDFACTSSELVEDKANSDSPLGVSLRGYQFKEVK